MRRFIVEALADALVLLVIILLLSIPTVSQPFPFGPDSAPILQLRGAGVLHVPRRGDDPRRSPSASCGRSSSRSRAG